MIQRLIFMRFPILSADEAAALIAHGETLGLSGFTPAGSVKALPAAIARRAKAEHAAGRPFQVNVVSGASTSEAVDGVLAEADALALRAPFQSSATMRSAINSRRVPFVDMHLSTVAQAMRMGHLPQVTTAIIEVCEVTDEGDLTLTASQGNSACFCRMAQRIILELNTYHKPELKAVHDVYEQSSSPYPGAIAISRPEDRIGSGTLRVDPQKIAGVVLTHEADHLRPYKTPTDETTRIGRHIADFLRSEHRAGRLPRREHLIIQSGVGNIANAALKAIGEAADFPPIKMYTEVLQDAALELIENGRCLFASSCALTLTDDALQHFYERFEFFRERILLRPAEISNSPEIAHRLGTICMNAALEADICGNVNSSHVCGQQIMNGVGGSGDFARSGALTIFMCPSVAKGGCISCIVPMVSHTDHPEHDVDVLVTEQGVADLRGKSPRERAAAIIERCAHPDYKPLLRRYVELSPTGHSPHDLRRAFAFHLAYLEHGDMRDSAHFFKS